ncbi:YtxH domain-containing protein [Dyadobacter sp. CY345]|uniref:YtxH domain-containing protein n=1 Tax=Dyadobacter sp. CY345 TaxID=2909335 RepID=UPI001F21293C|nr:YtxH domain-containing protein [Dyadobacter sp. CY345]MCF2443373.1 YtxH domain-containing protein [Dyadobacter sp. CY345]
MKTKYGNVDFTNRSEHTDGLITGLLLGLAIGACGAILFAPKSGKAIREKIKDAVGKKASDLDNQWENAKDKAADAASNAKDAVESASTKAESKLNQFADKAENEVTDGVETVIDKFQKRY